MGKVSVRDLRNNGGRVLQRVARGEVLQVTMDGRPVAELRPIRAPGLSATTILERWRGVPPIDAAALRADIDAILDTAL